MKVLGIDPGTITMGYGVIEAEGNSIRLIDYGALKNPRRSSIEERLSYLYSELLKIISRHQPDMVAIEQPFMGENARSALAIGRAQAVAMLAATNQGIQIREYTPAEVKQAVADHGASSKERVQEMVKLQLQMAQAPQPSDAADALAIAMCHVRKIQIEKLLSGNSYQGER